MSTSHMHTRSTLPTLGRWCLVSLAALMMLAGSVRGDEPAPERRAFDPATGRNLLNYPPHRSADVRHMRLQFRIPDMNQRVMLASETLTIAPFATPVSTFSLNASLLQIAGVESPERKCTFVRNEDEQRLTIALDPPLPPGQTADVTINYRVSDPPEGITWTTESAAYPGQGAQLHSQGESESNRYWFASHDFPNERCTTEMLVTVPRGFQVVSNGRLESVKQDRLEPYDTFHWVQDTSHPSYLVTLVVGKFDVVDIGSGRLPMPVYVSPGLGGNVRRTFERTPRMIDLIAHLTGTPYPWAQYAQVCPRNYAGGGMENTSATTFFESIPLDKTAMLDGDEDDLIVHELAHQWFGDLVTGKSWEHIWLNEGFATYVEALWAQYRESSIPGSGSGAGGVRGNDAGYQSTLHGWLQDVLKSDTGKAPFQPAMASKEYDAPDDVFDRAANPYPKGALVLHMLRQKLGDEVFFRGLADYLHKYKYGCAETFQFREMMERAGGESLQRFFDQWVFRPGVPRIRVTPTWDASSGTLSVAFQQTQDVDGYNPAFDVQVPVWVRVKGSSTWRRLEARFDTASHTLSERLPGEPEMIAVDPELETLADYGVQIDGGMWGKLVVGGPTSLARLRAAEAAARLDPSNAPIGALAQVLRDDRSPRELRTACAKSLGELKAWSVLWPVFESGIGNARVRSAVIEAMASAASDDAARAALAERLPRVLSSDASYGVRSAAARALGTVKGPGAMAAITQALGTRSQHEQIRKAALDALAELDQPGGLEVAMRAAALGNPPDVRPAAAEAIGRLGHQDPDRALGLLVALLDDPQPKTALAAGKALAKLGGTRARKALEDRAASSPSRFFRAQAKEWVRGMKDDKAQASVP